MLLIAWLFSVFAFYQSEKDNLGVPLMESRNHHHMIKITRSRYEVSDKIAQLNNNHLLVFSLLTECS
jgi:hypothetical protein